MQHDTANVDQNIMGLMNNDVQDGKFLAGALTKHAEEITSVKDMVQKMWVRGAVAGLVPSACIGDPQAVVPFTVEIKSSMDKIFHEHVSYNAVHDDYKAHIEIITAEVTKVIQRVDIQDISISDLSWQTSQGDAQPFAPNSLKNAFASGHAVDRGRAVRALQVAAHLLRLRQASQEELEAVGTEQGGSLPPSLAGTMSAAASM